jgi:hypothetical protein
VSVCLQGGRNAEQIEGAVLCAGGGGKDGGEAIAAEADDIAGANSILQPSIRRGMRPPKVRFAPDSSLEGTGFEPSVPREKD